MQRLLLCFFTLLLCGSVYGKSKITNSPLLLLSIDGFAYNYLTTYQPKNILNFAKSGVSTKLLPVYPSKTFPNHLSIITGTYPAKHGIIHNKFYHPDLKKEYRLGAGKKNKTWVTAKPFWSFAEENKIISAVYFWPESEMIGQGRSPRYNIPYNKKDTDKARFDQIIKWLKLPEEQAPKFIVSYFSCIDEAGHTFGLNSPELATAIMKIDNLFGNFITRLQQEIPKGINIILVSDHGMIQTNKSKTIDLSMVFTKEITTLINEKAIIVAKSNTQLYLHFNQDKLTTLQQQVVVDKINSKQKQYANLYNVYQKQHYPKHWQFNNSLVITPDVIVEAKPAAIFNYGSNANTSVATHGYDALNQDSLQAIFFAGGPDIVKGRVLEPFENIHIVSLMSELLGIQQLDNIDGKREFILPILKSTKLQIN